MTTILIGGDTCPIGRNQSLFKHSDVQSLLNDLLPEFEKADLCFVNLECPLIEMESPIEKVGPTLGAPVDSVNGLTAMGIDVVGLANNHIMDHGPEGLRSTIRALEESGISYVGAGENLFVARKILVRTIDGIRIGFLAVAEHEFGISSEMGPGVSPLDVIDIVRNINSHSKSYEKLIVVVHGGNELYQYPRFSVMNISRFLVEHGADAVIWQHSHCAGCLETYKGVPLVYGQGNFLFDYNTKSVMWHEGALICLETDGQSTFNVRLIPYRQSDEKPGARRMTKEEEESFIKGFTSRSQAIRDESFVKMQWELYCQGRNRYYLQSLNGRSGLVRRVLGKLNLPHRRASRKDQLVRLNMIRCESHREALIELLNKEIEVN